MNSQCRGIAATEIASRSWDTARGDTEEGKRHHPTRKEQGRQRGMNTHSAPTLSLHANSASLLPVTETQSRLAWAAQQQTSQQDTGIRENNSRLEQVILHTNHRHKVTVSFLSLGCGNTPRWANMSNLPYSALASSPAAGPPKPMSFLSLGAKEEEVFSSPKPCTGPPCLSRRETQRKTTRDRQKEVQGLGVPHTASPVSWPPFLPFEGKKGVWNEKAQG